MTKKDYIVLAKGVRMAFEAYRAESVHRDTLREIELVLDGFSQATVGLMNALKSDNPNFNSQLFLRAIYPNK